MSEIRTNILISGESSEYRSNIEISVVTLNSALVDTHSSFRTNLDITTTLKDGSISAIKTNLELNNVALKFYLVDMTKLKQSLLYFSKFFNMYFEPEVMWDLLAQGTNEQINISHLNEALSNYVKVDITNNILTDLERVKLNLQEHIKDNKKHFTEKEKEFLLNLMENPNSFGSEDSLFEKVSINQNNIILPAVKPLKQDGKDAGIISNTFISCRGIDSTASSGSGGITRIDLFNILSGEPINDSEFINNKFLKISPLIENWIRNNLADYETDPTVPIFVKNITEDQIKSWNAVASWFDISEDESYIFTTDERGFISHSFISCKGLDLNAASSGGSFSRSELFDILSENPQEGERINLKYLIGLEELVESFGFLKDINKNQVIAALGYTPLKKDDFKDFATVSNIVKQDVDNWNFVFSLIGLSEDESYIFPKESRGFASDSFISCKGLDETAPQVGGTFDRSSLFEILSNEPQDGEFIDLRFLNLNDYVTIDYITSQGYITSNALSGYATQQWVLNKNYASQDDLAAILRGMEADIANRVLIEDFEKLEEAVLAIDISGLSKRLDVAEQAIKTNATAIATNATNITNLNNRVKTLEDLGLTLEGDAETGYYVKSAYSFVSQGEIISGRRASGSGSGGGGGISEITAQMVVDALGYVPYSSQNPAGYITPAAIPTALKNPFALTINGHTYDGSEAVNITISAGGGVVDSVDWVNVYNKPTTLGGYGITDAAGAGIAGGDGFVAIPYTNNQSVFIYYRGGFDWRVTNEGWVNSYKLLHEGNYFSYALPLSGGELQGTTDTPLYLNGTDGSYIGFRNSAKSILGYFGFDSEQTPKVHIGYNYQYALIHSGNIGSQSVNYANSANSSLYSYRLTIDNNPNVSDMLQYMQLASQNDAEDLPTNSWWHIIKMGHGNADTYYNRTLAFSFWNNSILTRNRREGTASDWEELAFLSSNVASATKLQTARTIWGQLFDGSADVSGALFGATYIKVNEASVNGIYLKASSYTSVLGESDIAIVTPKLAILNGNVLIGTTTDNGSRLNVNGGITATEMIKTNSAIVTNFYGNATCGLYPNSWITGDGVNNRLWLYNDNNLALYGKHIELKSDTIVDGQVSINFGVDAVDPVTQAIVINSANYASTYAAWPGIGFHIPGSTYATIKFGNDTCFHFMNYALSGWVDVKVGNLIATGEVISSRRASSSDARLKDNINRLIAEDCLAMVRNLQPSSWDWKENGEHSMGFIAQDIEPLMPYAVTRIKDEILGYRLNLQYDQFFAPVVGAIQCLDSEVEQLKKRVKYLENKLQEYGYNRY